MRFLRYAAGYAAVAAAVPYFVLKIIWLAGGSTGIIPGNPQSAEFDALNAATFAMDAVAIAVALALTHRWGERLSAPLVLFPMWVGVGFLTTIVIGVPVGLAVKGQSLFEAADGLVEPWVYQLVYGGFIVQGLALTVAFFLYARRRWPSLPVGEPYRLLATVAAVMSFAIGLLYLSWAFGSTFGLPEEAIATSAFTGRVMDGLFGIFSILGGIGLLRLNSWLSVSLAWLGSGTNFAWGLWVSVNMLIDSPLTVGTKSLGLLGLANFTRVLAGMLAGLVAAYWLRGGSERLRA